MTLPFLFKRMHLSDASVPWLSTFVIAIFLCCTPCLAAGYLYLDTGTQPTLSAHAEGDTRYYPGDTFSMTVILTNKGRDKAMQVEPHLSPSAYDPSTALGVLVRPQVGHAPISLKSLPTVAGDIGSWDQVPVTILGTVYQNATPGVYTIPLEVTYNYVYAIPLVGSDFTTIEVLYHQNQQTLPIPIRVMSEVRPVVISEHSENMVPDTQGYLVLEIMNTGYSTGEDVSFSIVPSNNVTFQMVDSSLYVKRFSPGNVTTLKARIAVKDHTGAGSYPALLVGQYRDTEGVVRNTQSVPVGITVSKGAVFEAITKDLTISPGGTETITVAYRNTGDTPAYNAQARLIGNQILEPVTDTVSLGLVRPGETKTAQFVISAKSALAGKQYIIDTDVKYRDELDAPMLSDNMSFGVAVIQPSGIAAITSNPVILIIIAGALVIIIYVIWRLRKRKI